jgi:hypothetical protein
MSETKYGKYIYTDMKKKIKAPWNNEYKPEEKIPLLYLDSSFIEEAFYVGSAWFLPPRADKEEGDDQINY